MLRSKVLASLLGCGLCAFLSGCGGTTSGSAANSIWVTSWADSPSAYTGGPGTEMTVRQLVKPTVGSRGTVRLHFSNYFGTAPITLGAVHVGIQTTGSGVSGDLAVTFSGSNSVTIPAGGFATSDNVPLAFPYGKVLSVTEYLTGSWANLTAHAQGVNIVTNYTTNNSAGNQTGDTTGITFSNTTVNTYLLDRVDVYGNYKETIAAFGSSTTDGYMSGLDTHMTYPEQLAAALHAAGHDDIGIANEGIAGTEVLGTSAIAGVNRFTRDVTMLPHVTAVIDYLGANDLRTNCVSASTLIPGKLSLISMAHAAGLKIYEATTAPSTYCNAQNPNGFGTRYPQGAGEEAERGLVNAWQITTAPSTVEGVSVQPPGADGMIDFNASIVDPTNTSYMLPALDSGDDIHPNATGYGVMVKAISLSLF